MLAVLVKRGEDETTGDLVCKAAEEVIEQIESGNKYVLVRLSDEEEPEVLDRIAWVVLGYIWQKYEPSDFDALWETCVSSLNEKEMVISIEWV